MRPSEFIDLFESLLDVGDRQVRCRNDSGLVFVNFFNLPSEVFAAREGGGAEAENNRMMFTVSGFDGYLYSGKSYSKPPANGKLRVEMSVSAFPRAMNLRAKAAAPEKIAEYLAAYVNRIAATVPPKFTHTR